MIEYYINFNINLSTLTLCLYLPGKSKKQLCKGYFAYLYTFKIYIYIFFTCKVKTYRWRKLVFAYLLCIMALLIVNKKCSMVIQLIKVI